MAFQTLARSRPIVGGMVMLPRPIDEDVIRGDGVRRGYIGDGLTIFVRIIMAVDDFWLETEMKRLDTDLKWRASEKKR